MPTAANIKPDDPRATAFREFLAVSRAALAGSAEAVWAPDGSANQAGDLPESRRVVRLSPEHPAEEAIATGRNPGERLWHAPIDVTVEARNVGSEAANSANLWGKLLDALAANRVRLRRAGISDWTVTKPATTPAADAIALGSLRLDVYLYR